MTVGAIQAVLDDFPPEMEVKVAYGTHQKITNVSESSHLTDPDNDTGENYLVIYF